MGAAALPAAIGLQGVGTVTSAYGARNAALAQEGYYRYLANQSESNANLVDIAAERQAHEVEDSAALSHGQLKRSYAAVKGAQKAAVGAAGIAGGATAEDIARDTASKEVMDELAIRFNADNQASDVLRQAGITSLNLRAEAAGYRLSAAEAGRSASRNFATTLIGGAGSIASTAALAYKPGNVPGSTAGAVKATGDRSWGTSLFPPAGAPKIVAPRFY